MMSHVLQWTQLDALMCSRFPPPAHRPPSRTAFAGRYRARIGVLDAALRAADVEVVTTVRRLILAVPRAGRNDVGQLVERELAIDLTGLAQRRGLAARLRKARRVFRPLVTERASGRDPPAFGRKRQPNTSRRRTGPCSTPGDIRTGYSSRFTALWSIARW
jgi:hypothetical protein